MLLFPYSYTGLNIVFANIKRRHFYIYVVPAFIELFLIINFINLHINFPKVPSQINDMAVVMKHKFNNNTKVLVDDWNWLGCYALASTGYEFEGSGLCGTNPDRVFLGPGFKTLFPRIDSLIYFLYSQKPEYMLYAFGGKFPMILGFSGNKEWEEKFGCKFKKIINNEYFCLYKIFYQNE